MLLSRIIPILRICILFGATVLMLLLPRWLLRHRYADRILDPQEVPARPIAIVLGAGLRRDGRPTTVLADRVRTAVTLYRSGKTGKILMSGSSSAGKDEPQAMRSLALKLGVPDEDILVDREGIRTFETCLRASKIFGVDQALIITQRFHLPRAMALCEAHNVDAIGVPADLRPYRSSFIWNLREIPASLRAFWDVYRHHSVDDKEPAELSPQEPNCS
jgi:vancomycin permeability regulator SanA